MLFPLPLRSGAAALAIFSLSALALGACSGDDAPPAAADAGSGGDAAGASAFERAWRELEASRGCTPVTLKPVPAACEAAAQAFVTCAAKDARQCACENDGSLNCEGAYKPDEGPALCVAENAALEACLDD